LQTDSFWVEGAAFVRQFDWINLAGRKNFQDFPAKSEVRPVLHLARWLADQENNPLRDWTPAELWVISLARAVLDWSSDPGNPEMWSRTFNARERLRDELLRAADHHDDGGLGLRNPLDDREVLVGLCGELDGLLPEQGREPSWQCVLAAVKTANVAGSMLLNLPAPTGRADPWRDVLETTMAVCQAVRILAERQGDWPEGWTREERVGIFALWREARKAALDAPVEG